MQKRIIVEFTLLISVGFYYFLFLNKGLSGDEGYYAHNATRILDGQLPYKDFFIQYSPGYFYLLALVYRIFGISIETGRYLTFVICLIDLFLVFKILNLYGLENTKYKIISTFAISSFGFPLINNMSLLAWINVMLVLFSSYFYLRWIERKSFSNLFALGIFLSTLFFTKQNLGIYFFLLFLFLVYVVNEKSLAKRIQNMFYLGFITFMPGLLWIYVFFLKDNIEGFLEMVKFNRQYLNIYPFSYPPLNFLFQPLGILKLIPYYLPIIFLGFILLFLFQRKKTYKDVVIPFSGLTGFAGTVFPTSDLLHVYPFFGLILVGIIIFFYKTKYYAIWLGFVFLCVGIGFYLVLFKGYYRYHLPYRYQNTLLNLPRTHGIMVERNFAESASRINQFLNSNSSYSKYVLMYPFNPMLYFIFEKLNPSRFSIYYPGYLTELQEAEVISDLKTKNVKYVVTYGQYKFDTLLSKFIQKKKIVYSDDQFRVFSLY